MLARLLVGAGLAVLCAGPVHAGDHEITQVEADALFRRCNHAIGKGALGRALNRVFSFERQPREKKPAQCVRLRQTCRNAPYAIGGNMHRLCLRFGEGATAYGLHMTAYGSVRQPEQTGPTAITVSAKTRGITGTGLGVAGVIGAELGSGSEAGLLWEFDFGLGVGTTLGPTGAVGITAGFGGSGWTGNLIPSALLVPIEAFATANIGRWVHVLAWIRQDVVVGSSLRQDGAEHVLFGDEMRFGFGIGFGNHPLSGGKRDGAGLFVGVSYREQLGQTWSSIIIGYGSASHSGR